MASAVRAFVAECCELGEEYTVLIDALYRSYRAWCEGSGAKGYAERLPINQFSGKLRSAFHGQIQTIRPRVENSLERKRKFSGIRLRKGWSA
jgi:phage/plasmid-associated DNA primase